jgi:N-acetylneuraminic acid mutarotase
MKRAGVTKLVILIAVSIGGLVGMLGGSAAAPLVQQLASSTSPQAAAGKSFTYQGYLTQNGGPINGQCDGQFGLWDAQSGGTQLGSTQTVANLDVTNGYFTAELNSGGEFGATAFAGQARYLEIAVRCPAGSGTFTVLGRQALTATPYAVHAANGVPSGELILSSSASAPSGYTYSGMQMTPDHRWSHKAPLPTARTGAAAVAVGAKIYAIGGGGGGFLTTVEEYDPATNTWSSKAPMPTSRMDLAAAVVNNKIYAIGGFGGGGGNYLATVEEYDVATNSWSPKAPMPTARGILAAVAVGTKIYAIGGTNGFTDFTTVEEYDVATNSWSPKAPMPTARYYLAAAAVNNKIYAIGGHVNNGPDLATVEEYDVATNSWSSKAPMPTARAGLAAAAVSTKIYAIGGINDSGYQTTVEEYDGTNDSWNPKPAMPTARYDFAAAALNDKVYAIGGFTSGYLAAVEEYHAPSALYLHRKN